MLSECQTDLRMMKHALKIQPNCALFVLCRQIEMLPVFIAWGIFFCFSAFVCVCGI